MSIGTFTVPQGEVLEITQHSSFDFDSTRHRGINFHYDGSIHDCFAASHYSSSLLLAAYGLKYEPQSGSHMANEVSGLEKANITTFDDDGQIYEDGFMKFRDDTYYVADSEEFSVEKYFSRPIKLGSYSWTVGTAFTGIALSPFQLFWENKRNINRLATYRNLKCDMCVRIVINGTPFHYGILQAAAYPDTRADGLSVFADGEINCVRGSQVPHLLLDPTTSTGGCLSFPYSYWFNAFVTTTTPSQLTNAGTLVIRELIPLRHVSGVTEPITVSVFAWAENVVLGAPTSINPVGLVPQSGDKEEDEYGQGVISRPAFILSKIAGSLRGVPYIGPYAMSTSMGADRLGRIAQIFGHVKPSIVDDFKFVNMRRTPNFASATQHDPVFKATFDDKQEVTIDPRVTGFTGEDQMSIVNIAKRPSYLTNFPWTQTNTSETRLFSIMVSPQQNRVVGSGLNAAYYLTPAAFVTTAFNYWRGSMKFKFQCVASAFHRGRLRIVYEPDRPLGTTLTDFNTNLTYIWDISKEKEAIIEVGWHQAESYCDVIGITQGINITPFSNTITLNLGVPSSTCNGFLHVYVLNELTAPDNGLSADVSVMVTTAMCDDFEVFDPTDRLINFDYYPQSGDTALDEKVSSASFMGPAHVTFGKTLKDDATSAIYYGDPILSLRTLLKRYNYYRTESMPIVSTGSEYSWGMSMASFPLSRGRAPGAVDSATTPINFTAMTTLNYFAPAFLGWRGGIRHRFINVTRDFTPTAVDLKRTQVTAYFNGSTALAPSTTQSLGARTAQVYKGGRSGNPGMNPAIMAHEDGIDMEVPYHTRQRYGPCRVGNPNSSSAPAIGLSLSGRIVLPAGTFAVAYDHYISVSDDFMLTNFIDVPIMYFHTAASLPAAT